MSAEEIINTWKNEHPPGKKPGKALRSARKSRPAQKPGNPAGEQELSDEDLAFIEGGQPGQGSTLQCTIGHCTISTVSTCR